MKNLSLLAIILSLGSIAFAQGATNESEKSVAVNPVTNPTVPNTTNKGEKVGNYWQDIKNPPSFQYPPGFNRAEVVDTLVEPTETSPLTTNVETATKIPPKTSNKVILPKK